MWEIPLRLLAPFPFPFPFCLLALLGQRARARERARCVGGPQHKAEDLAALGRLVEEGRLRTPIDRVLPLDQARAGP